ncbi:HAD-IIIC family phosphatase [Paenibacillus lutrae]|uniref:HAD-IIIC family phosphatase n=1 Tax=Paenibacillus lutrae TaxID=2078573 RepID=A0A7X3FF79_9BACL|nr:HAD-IIIC family phosphatase [Paenibacillus lutrae]MVO98620.1 HAD-IIIC family phosphatase [Paenibacillus lutrae]
MDAEEKRIKCLVWDLDLTLWDGILLEDGEVRLREGVLDIIRTLDERGILQSIASRNEYAHAMDKLEQLGVAEYFIYPQISWNSKSQSIREITEQINIGLDAVAFIDDQQFEREEVNFHLPEVWCLDAAELESLTDKTEMIPRIISPDARQRRGLYKSEIERKKAEEHFTGDQNEFLSTLDMVMQIHPVTVGDLERAEELTVRTHQLNATGYTYSYEELLHFSRSESHLLLICELDDRFGRYGKIGLALIECIEKTWVLKLMLTSCRVMSRGVGTVLLNHIIRKSIEADCRLLAEYLPNDRNRMMHITYKFAGFKEIGQEGNTIIFEHDGRTVQPAAEYVKLIATG